MMIRLKNFIRSCVPVVILGAATMQAEDKPVSFVMHRVGNFRSEACGVADFNGDKKPDIVAGEYVYLAPDWKAVKIRTIGGSVDDAGKGYRWDFANIPVDVDGDGLMDVVSVDWFDKRAVWCRNTGAAGGEWPLTVIQENGNFECAELWDLDGKGKKTAIVPAVKHTAWYEVDTGSDGKKTLATHMVSEKQMDWGVGVGDVNGDGRPDILRPNAWFEAPKDIRKEAWIEHPIALGKKGGGADHTAQILVLDVNADGTNDIITSAAHGFGIFWYEQVCENGQTSFKQHVIDDTWTQAHSLSLGDLDGCGLPELATGKRFMAHNGSDPKESDPLGVYYYKLKRDADHSVKWEKHGVSSNEGIGSGMNICLEDMDSDGDLDIVVTGKWGGPVWFENKVK